MVIILIAIQLANHASLHAQNAVEVMDQHANNAMMDIMLIMTNAQHVHHHVQLAQDQQQAVFLAYLELITMEPTV